jgi:fatty acid desaturase
MASRTIFFRYNADVRPVAWVHLAALLTLAPFALTQVASRTGQTPALWAFAVLWLVSLYARCRGPYSQHNHAHLAVFGSRGLNTVYDVVLTFVTGYPTALWELHHNIGHHRSFLEPETDVASTHDPKTGRTFSRVWYTIRGNATIHRDSLRIAKGEALRGRPRLLRKLWFELAVQALILGVLFAWKPMLTFSFVVVPNALAGALVWWESYVHHLGVPSTGIYDGSVTTTGERFNHVNFNIGHHTAHHEKPTLHWSLLPGRTDVIASKIPEVCWRGATPGPGGLALPADQPRDPRPVPSAASATASIDRTHPEGALSA